MLCNVVETVVRESDEKKVRFVREKMKLLARACRIRSLFSNLPKNQKNGIQKVFTSLILVLQGFEFGIRAKKMRLLCVHYYELLVY